MTPVRINGLRLSGRLCRLYQEVNNFRDAMPAYLYGRLASARINITFLSLDFLRSPGQINCLVAADLPRDWNGIYKTDLNQAAGLISLFPHRYDPAVMGAVFRAVGEKKLPWYCMATSGSMLTMATDFAVQQQAALSVSCYVDLPPDHGPLRPEQDYDVISRRLKTEPETVAQYVEERIRTYGIQVKTNLTLCRIRIQPEAQVLIGRCLESMGSDNVRFAYASADSNVSGEIHAVFVLEPGKSGAHDQNIASYFPSHFLPDIEIRENVQMVGFHGPHFGDRYGIADKALRCLSDAGVPVWMAGCVGATVTIIVLSDMGIAAVEALSAKFDNP